MREMEHKDCAVPIDHFLSLDSGLYFLELNAAKNNHSNGCVCKDALVHCSFGDITSMIIAAPVGC